MTKQILVEAIPDIVYSLEKALYSNDGQKVPVTKNIARYLDTTYYACMELQKIGRAVLEQIKDATSDARINPISIFGLYTPHVGKTISDSDMKKAIKILNTYQAVTEWRAKLTEFRKLKSLDSIL